jgi:hypothetical protein
MTNRLHGPTVRRVARDPGSARGGIGCPQCGGQIDVTLDALLVRRAFTCATAGCGVVLRLDQRESTQALDTLRELRHRLREIGTEL